MVSRWFSGLRGGLILGLIALGVVVAVASAKQVTTGHSEISGRSANVPNEREHRIFSHKNFASVEFGCLGAQQANLQVHNLENRTIRATYVQFGQRESLPVKPGDTERKIHFTDPDVGITDLSHKYATLDIDWGRRPENDSCDLAVHTILHFPDGTPLNG